MKKDKPQLTGAALEKRRRQVEGISTFGLLLLAVAMLCPFMNLTGSEAMKYLEYYKWIYAAGALVFTVARMVSVHDPKDSLRLRRLRRLEFWAGMAFCIGAFFWFYNEQRLAGTLYVGPLAILRDTVVFSMVGAVLQAVASWMIVYRTKKEAAEREGSQTKGAKK